MVAPGDRVVVVSNRMWCTRRNEAMAVTYLREELLKRRSSLRGHVFTVQSPPPGGVHGHVYLRIEASVLVPVPSDEVRPVPSRAQSRVLLRGYDGPEMLMALLRAGLPTALARRAMEDYLSVDRVRASDVTVAGASSVGSPFPPEALLTADENTWWLSRERGRDEVDEWVQLNLPGPRRVSAAAVRIPPMPQGPLGVRKFDVERSDGSGAFVRCGSFETADVAGLQEFLLESPVDASAVRIRARSVADPRFAVCGLLQVALF